jgi:hypothetical protein
MYNIDGMAYNSRASNDNALTINHHPLLLVVITVIWWCSSRIGDSEISGLEGAYVGENFLPSILMVKLHLVLWRLASVAT